MAQFYPIIVALCFNGFDLLSGIVGALKNHELKSSELRDGLFKKIGFLMCYFLSWLLDTHGGAIGFNINVSILPIIVLYSCTTETVSIIENICEINSDFVPEKLKEFFHINDKED